MKLEQLLKTVLDKTHFQNLTDFSAYGYHFLEFIQDGLQAIIVSQNENQYRFLQYKEDGTYNITRPINSQLMISVEQFEIAKRQFEYSLKHIQEIKTEIAERENINCFVYTCQQAIGATLDALPAGQSNTARKINGDLFETYIRLLIQSIGVDVKTGYTKVPVLINGVKQFDMSYQHDLIVEKDEKAVAIGSVKTSSKDRIDKIFIDKFLYNRLKDSETPTPHFAIFLNDVQRNGKEPHYGINTTFLTGHFKGYTVKLNPLDGVYYCDLRPIMKTDALLKENIHSLDYLLIEDIWKFLDK